MSDKIKWDCPRCERRFSCKPDRVPKVFCPDCMARIDDDLLAAAMLDDIRKAESEAEDEFRMPEASATSTIAQSLPRKKKRAVELSGLLIGALFVVVPLLSYGGYVMLKGVDIGSLTLSGTKLTQSNLAKLQDGMSLEEVEKIIGPNTTMVLSLPGASAFQWAEGEDYDTRSIAINFENGKLTQKIGTNLPH